MVFEIRQSLRIWSWWVPRGCSWQWSGRVLIAGFCVRGSCRGDELMCERNDNLSLRLVLVDVGCTVVSLIS